MPYLEIKLGPDTMLLRFVGRIDYVFGRLPRADVQLRDMKVSRLHTQFFIDSRGGAFVRDLGSSGGTWVNNQRLRRGVIAPLTEGLKVRVGDAKVTFYDREPPVNAVEPPSRSDPRGLVRTNPRERFLEAEATVLAVDKVDPETQSGPAEPPPEINPADFADKPEDLAEKKRPPKQHKPITGIVEAPWEKPGSSPGAGKEKRVTVPPPTRNPAPVAASDEAPPQLAPAQLEGDGLDATGRTSREPVVEDEAEFSPPPPIQGDLPVTDDEPPPRLGMPTVRLERPSMEDRKRLAEEEESDAAPSKIPTAKVKPADALADEPEPEPQIGTAPRTDTPVAEDDEESLTDEEIAEYMGGSASARFDAVDFGDGESTESSADDENEVSFGSAAKVGMTDGDADIDLEDAAPPEEEAETAGQEPQVSEATTSRLGSATELAEEVAEEIAEQPADEPVPDVPSYDDTDTPPPPSRQGATEERTFKPRKTRKLMKRRRDTGKITDKSNPTPPPKGDKTSLVVDKPIAQGAKTLFIPKPEVSKDGPSHPERPTGKPRRLDENIEKKDISELGEGPGGDTVALPPAMMKRLKDELAKKDEPPSIGDSPTVKIDDDDDEEEFVLDEDYAFFTPPPATRKAREAAAKAAKQEGDLINANDFHSETDNLPKDRKAKSKEDPDTIVD